VCVGVDLDDRETEEMNLVGKEDRERESPNEIK